MQIKKPIVEEVIVEEPQPPKKVIIKDKITLKELDNMIEEYYWKEYGCKKYYWVNPKDIVGINYKEIQKNIKNDPTYYTNVDLDDDIGFYMTDLIISKYCDINPITKNRLSKELPELLEKLSFIARNLYSFSPAYSGVYSVKVLLTKENICESLEVAQKEYSRANGCEKIFLSVLYLNFFDIVLCTDVLDPGDEECIDINYFNKQERLFLEHIKEFALRALQNDNEELIKNCED